MTTLPAQGSSTSGIAPLDDRATSSSGRRRISIRRTSETNSTSASAAKRPTSA